MGGQSLLLTYGRYFAEFLNEHSLVHLGTLMPTYLCRFTVRLSKNQANNFFLALFQLKLTLPKLCLPPTPCGASDVHTIERLNLRNASVIGLLLDSAGILTCSSIDYAFRPRLRID